MDEPQVFVSISMLMILIALAVGWCTSARLRSSVIPLVIPPLCYVICLLAMDYETALATVSGHAAALYSIRFELFVILVIGILLRVNTGRRGNKWTTRIR